MEAAAMRPGAGHALFPFFMHQYQHAAMTGINTQRFRLPLQQPPFHFPPAASLFPALNVNHPSIIPTRPLLHPTQAQPPSAALPPRMPSTPQLPQPPAVPTPSTQPPTISSVSPLPTLTLTFTQEEVDMVLYGYTKGRPVDRYHGHALSGLKFGDLSHGIDRILSGQHSPNESGTGTGSDVSGSTCERDSGSNGGSTASTTTNNNSIVKHSPGSYTTISPSPFTPPTPPQQHHHLHHHQQQQPQQHNTSLDHHHHHPSPSPNNNHHHHHQQHEETENKWNIIANINNHTDINNTQNNNKSNNSTSRPLSHDHNQAGHMVSKLHLDPSALDLQEGLAIFQTQFAGTVHTGVFCTKTVIARGTRYGPFKGRVVNTSEVKGLDDNSVMWEIFQEGKLSHFIDGQSGARNWMTFINCARYAQEQNLIAIQVDGEIWYETCKDIPQGTELLVWYGDCYLQFMGVPVALKEMADGGAQDEADSSEGFNCDRCGKVFAYKYYRDKHLKYTRCVDQGDRKYPCHLCNRSFEKRDRLRIHILHVHEKHRPHKCLVCGKSFSQSSSLNKHMRVHSGERPYKCVYCNKAFTASSILRTHIRQHSGEKPFKCKHCGKAFASHAAHDSHVRRTHAKERPCTCTICGKSFQQAYQLKFHMGSHMGH